ncbi:non-structural maintenance of chromosomes element 1 homolog [Exaiptasia diaphana]|uniref:Non-structural maintenance of chromosomes element 1 homolog n=1 Tax=Exaiptasia diaphana TaxID=2652724 RepID=A0A913YBD6_EXADI|nr:non-structural maintenance of chromosomes element 1 homolog [Exaiptasia diaphana]KXJ21232.1 Non-structural maintenance of chromosomes element 1-like [Exaiptasia diaphana]
MSVKDSHRLFLRTLMTRPFLPEREVKRVYQQCCEAFDEDYSSDQFQPFLAKVNKIIQPLFLEVKAGVSENEGIKYYALINTTEDEHSKMATDYTPNDIAFFKKAIDLIINSDDGSVSSMDLMNVASDLEKKMLCTYAEKLLKRLVDDKWLTESSGIYYLGGRAMIDIDQYLKREYKDDLSNCMMCDLSAIQSQMCQHCQEKLHKHCAAKYFNGRAQRTCPNPNCGAQWTHEVPIIASTSTDRSSSSSRQAGPSTSQAGPSRSRSRRSR